MNALIHSTYLYSLGMSTKIQVLNYRSVTTIIDLIFFPSQLLDINVNKIHFFSTPAVFQLRMKITVFFLECLTVTNSFLHRWPVAIFKGLIIFSKPLIFLGRNVLKYPENNLCVLTSVIYSIRYYVMKNNNKNSYK